MDQAALPGRPEKDGPDPAQMPEWTTSVTDTMPVGSLGGSTFTPRPQGERGCVRRVRGPGDPGPVFESPGGLGRSPTDSRIAVPGLASWRPSPWNRLLSPRSPQ